mmetsp:Transcript_2827/g.6598  ORF Transcript_2827/g.6598 Transcript_2827/m.6598 type:complete len:445 (-) Transcript_2827:9-1343(-)
MATSLPSTKSLGEVQKYLSRSAPDGTTPQADVMRYKLVFLATQLRGEMVKIQLTDGVEYEGIFYFIDFEQGQISLKLVSGGAFQGVKPYHSFKMDHIVSVNVTGSQFSKRAQQNFKTDTQISGARRGKRRELQEWKPDREEDLPVKPLMYPAGKRWDQFEANEKLTGKRSSKFNMNDYSTNLDKDSEFYKAHERDAAKLAAEIEGKRPPIRSSWRKNAKDDDDDEEALHSRVIRDDEVTKVKPEDAPNKPEGSKVASQPEKGKSPVDSKKEMRKGLKPERKAATEKKEKKKSKLNPNAKEFKPKSFGFRRAKPVMPNMPTGFYPQARATGRGTPFVMANQSMLANPGHNPMVTQPQMIPQSSQQVGVSGGPTNIMNYPMDGQGSPMMTGHVGIMGNSRIGMLQPNAHFMNPQGSAGNIPQNMQYQMRGQVGRQPQYMVRPAGKQ